MENKLTVQNNYSIAELETMSKKVAQSNFFYFIYDSTS